MVYTVQFNLFKQEVTRFIDGETQIRKNFKLKELCNTKTDNAVKLVVNERLFLFLDMMQELRDRYGKPINVGSWYREEKYNKKIGGSSNSLHLDGLACDFHVDHNLTQHKNMETMWKAICQKHGVIGGINHYTHGYHVCIGEEKFGATAFVVRDYRGKKGDW